MPDWVHYLSDPCPFSAAEQRRRLGGKGASLRCLREAGLPVPPGFTITTDAVREFLSKGHWPAGVEAEVAAAFERLRIDADGYRRTRENSDRSLTASATELIEIPVLTVAVRSGAEASHPGLMRTILHCGWTESLAQRTNSASAWTEFADFLMALSPQAISTNGLTPAELCARLLEQHRQCGPVRDEPQFWLWEAINLVAESSRSLPPSDGDAAPSTAVTVQTMFPAEVSGVLFSCDPLDRQASHMVIEAVSGEGQRLMSGEVNPWNCRLDRLTLRPLVEARAGQPSSRPVGLTDQHLEEIARAALRMEAEFAGRPVDLEWGCASDRVVFFQVRPMPLTSSRDPDRDDSTFEICEQSRLRTFATTGRPLWVRYQLAESLPHPTPLSWSVWEQFLSPDGGLGALYRRLGFAPRRFADGQGFLQLIAGRVYADPDRLPQMICGSFPLRYSHQRLLESADELHDPPTEFDPERLDPWFLLKLPHLAWVMARSTWRVQRLRRSAARHFHESVVPEFLASLANQWAIDCGRLTLRELVSRAEECRAWLFDEWLPRLMLPGWLGVQAWQAVTRGLTSVLSADEVQAAKLALLSHLPHPGHECDVPTTTATTTALPFEGDFELAAQSAKQLTPPSIVSEVVNTESREWPEALSQLVSADRLRRLSRVIGSELVLVYRLLPLREVGKDCSRLGFAALHHIIRELAIRSGLGERLYFYRWRELSSLADPMTSGPTPALLDDRLAEWEFWRTQNVPQVLHAGHANFFSSDTAPSPHPMTSLSWQTAAKETGSTSRRFTARPLSPGKAAGVVWHWSKPIDLSPPPGCVIVANTMDAPTVRHCSAAVALIVEQGGLLSHAAVTARFVRLPMVVLDEAMCRLPAGALVTVDADTGTGIVTSEP